MLSSCCVTATQYLGNCIPSGQRHASGHHVLRILIMNFDHVAYGAQPATSPINKPRMWDIPRMRASFEELLSAATEPRAQNLSQAHAVATSESSFWLNALPVSSFGLCMDDEVVRIAAGLRLGVPLCCPHACCFVVPQWMSRQPTGSAASEVQVAIHAMWQSTT